MRINGSESCREEHFGTLFKFSPYQFFEKSSETKVAI